MVITERKPNIVFLDRRILCTGCSRVNAPLIRYQRLTFTSIASSSKFTTDGSHSLSLIFSLAYWRGILPFLSSIVGSARFISSMRMSEVVWIYSDDWTARWSGVTPLMSWRFTSGLRASKNWSAISFVLNMAQCSAELCFPSTSLMSKL